MKRALLHVLLLVLLPATALAQSLTIPQPSYFYWGDPSVNLASVTFLISNVSSSDIDIIVNKTQNNLGPFHSSFFCFGTSCYDTSVNVSGVFLFPANSNEIFIADINTNGSLGTSCVSYRISDVNNPTDFADVEICYYITSTGINDGIEHSVLSAAYPNPADNFAVIEYDLIDDHTKYSIIIYNLLGNKVKEIFFSGKNGLMMLPTSEMQSGLYFYSLLEGSRVISTDKLIVNHRN